MKYLDSQDVFESMWFHANDGNLVEGMRPSDKGWLVYFTAPWCGPCQRLDVAKLDETATANGLTLWKCDITKNDYTPGYCGIRSIPTFVMFQPKTVVKSLQSSDTETVAKWIQSL